MADQEKMNVDQFREHLKEQQHREDTRGRSKYGNIKNVVDGITFHSHKEAQYYGKLKLRVRAKDLLNFEMQKAFPLVVNGLHIATYIADFVLYYPDGRQEVVDVKSAGTIGIDVYRLKKALMKAIYKIEILEK